MNFTQGELICIDKPYGMSSFGALARVRYLISQRLGVKRLKTGHAGTLDPLATGVLILCTGRKTKEIESLQLQTKEYVATMQLGVTTPSFDMEHPVDRRYPYEHITREAACEALQRLTGERLQMPPVYSAKKIDGVRAYEMARAGEEAPVRKAPINIYELEMTRFELPYMDIRVRCSRGTYIRSLAAEIGEELRSGAYLTALRRTRSGGFRVEDALNLDFFLEKLSQCETKSGK